MPRCRPRRRASKPTCRAPVRRGSEDAPPAHGGAPHEPRRARRATSSSTRSASRSSTSISSGAGVERRPASRSMRTAVLVDGTPVDGPAALRAALLDRSDAFVTALTEKLLTYALGRILEAHDQAGGAPIVAAAAADDYRISSVVLGIASSVPFHMQTKRRRRTRSNNERRSALTRGRTRRALLATGAGLAVGALLRRRRAAQRATGEPLVRPGEPTRGSRSRRRCRSTRWASSTSAPWCPTSRAPRCSTRACSTQCSIRSATSRCATT